MKSETNLGKNDNTVQTASRPPEKVGTGEKQVGLGCRKRAVLFLHNGITSGEVANIDL